MNSVLIYIMMCSSVLLCSQLFFVVVDYVSNVFTSMFCSHGRVWSGNIIGWILHSEYASHIFTFMFHSHGTMWSGNIIGWILHSEYGKHYFCFCYTTPTATTTTTSANTTAVATTTCFHKMWFSKVNLLNFSFTWNSVLKKLQKCAVNTLSFVL